MRYIMTDCWVEMLLWLVRGEVVGGVVGFNGRTFGGSDMVLLHSKNRRVSSVSNGCFNGDGSQLDLRD